MTQLTITELKLFTRGRAGVGLGVSVGIPLLLLIIFGSIHSFKTPVKAFGGLTTLDVYIPDPAGLRDGPAVAGGHAGDAGLATGSWACCAG